MRRPTVVTVFAILNMVFGGIGFLCSPLSLLMLYLPQPAGAPPNPVLKLMQTNEALRTWTIASTVLTMAGAVVLFAAGLGLLNMKSWGRLASIGCAVYQIILGVIGMVASYFLLVVPLLEEARKVKGPAAFGTMIGAWSGCLGGVMGLVYPVLLLIFMTRPNVVQAFQAPEREGPFDEPYDPGF